MIESGALRSGDKIQGFVSLPARLSHTSFRDGGVLYTSVNEGTSVLFSTGWGLLGDEGFLYVSDDTPSHWVRTGRVVDVERIMKNWYSIFFTFGYYDYSQKQLN